MVKAIDDKSLAQITAAIKRIAAFAGGFLYYVSLKGVTGAGHLDLASVEEKLAEIRQFTELPVCVGFGIKHAEAAKAVAKLADGVVVGSAFVRLMGDLAGSEDQAIAKALGEAAAAIRTGISAASTN